MKIPPQGLLRVLTTVVLSASVATGCLSEPTPSAQALRQTAAPEPSQSVYKAPTTAPTPEVTPRPTTKPTARPAPARLRTVTGIASTYGNGYEGLLALPTALGGRGERVRICSTATGRCITRTSNDVGPVARLHRVADLDATDFNYLCRCRWQTKGVQKVTVTFL